MTRKSHKNPSMCGLVSHIGCQPRKMADFREVQCSLLVQYELKKWRIGVLQRGIFFLRLYENKTETIDCAVEEESQKALFFSLAWLRAPESATTPNFYYTTPRTFLSRKIYKKVAQKSPVILVQYSDLKSIKFFVIMYLQKIKKAT